MVLERSSHPNTFNAVGILTQLLQQAAHEASRRRRPSRRKLMCPCHSDEKLLSISPKHYLYATEVGTLVLRGLKRSTAIQLLAQYRNVMPLSGEWLEGFWCESCSEVRWWHVYRLEQHRYELKPIAQGLWEQVSGVIRPEGNPSVSQYTRKSARACGVYGLRQFRFV